MNIHVRRATIDDLHAIQSLSFTLFEYEGAYTKEYDLAWSHSTDAQKYFTKRLKSRSMFILLAQVDEQIVGYVSVCIAKIFWRMYNPIAEIENLCVDPLYRKKGVGKMLIGEVARIAKTRGAKRLRVTAIAQNDLALHFYRANGYNDVDIILEKDIV